MRFQFISASGLRFSSDLKPRHVSDHVIDYLCNCYELQRRVTKSMISAKSFFHFQISETFANLEKHFIISSNKCFFPIMQTHIHSTVKTKNTNINKVT